MNKIKLLLWTPFLLISLFLVCWVLFPCLMMFQFINLIWEVPGFWLKLEKIKFEMDDLLKEFTRVSR